MRSIFADGTNDVSTNMRNDIGSTPDSADQTHSNVAGGTEAKDRNNMDLSIRANLDANNSAEIFILNKTESHPKQTGTHVLALLDSQENCDA